MLDSLVRDLRYAVRWLRRSPAFTLVAVLSLGLGVGVNTAMYSLVDTLIFKPLPVSRPDELVDVFTAGGDGDRYATSSYPDFLDLRSGNDVFSDMLAFSPAFAAVSLGGGRSRLVHAQLVTSNHFTMLGAGAAVGRTLVPDDDSPAAARVVMLSDRMWRRDFGGDPGAVGRTLTIRGQAYTVVGVARPAFTGVVPMLVPELWLPIVNADEVEPAGISDSVPSPTGRTRIDRRGTRWMFVKGRLKPGRTAAEAHANVELIGRRLAASHPQTNENRPFSAVATNDVRFLVPQAGGVMAAGAAGVMAIVGLVLLIACANVAGMLLARATTREREISVRLAIGASRTRLLQQLLVEGLVLGVLGSIVALGSASLLLGALRAIELPLPGGLQLDFGLDRRVLAFALAVAAATGLLASLVPAIKASAPNLVAALRGERPAARVAGRRWALRDALVGLQIALTAVLLVVAGLLLRSLTASQRADVGFDTPGLAIVSTDTDMMRYSKERGEQFWQAALVRVRSLPGVEAAALASPRLPFDLNFSQREFFIDRRTYGPRDRGDTVMYASVSPGYFRTLGIAIKQGRDFAETDAKGALPVVVINEAMARRFWPGESAVGRTITVAATKEQYQVIGVAADHKVYSVGERPTPFVHMAVLQAPSSYNLLIARTRGSAEATLAAVRRELAAMEPDLVLVASQTMERAIAVTLLPARVGAALAAGFSLLGTLLAAIGLYGVIAYSVGRRMREIGIRIALGARPSGVVRLVLQQGLALTLAGLLAGLAIAALAARMLGGVLYGIGAGDPVAWCGAVAVLLGAAFAANAVPARRASRVDPAEALRRD
jgi:predicted permease